MIVFIIIKIIQWLYLCWFKFFFIIIMGDFLLNYIEFKNMRYSFYFIQMFLIFLDKDFLIIYSFNILDDLSLYLFFILVIIHFTKFKFAILSIFLFLVQSIGNTMYILVGLIQRLIRIIRRILIKFIPNNCFVKDTTLPESNFWNTGTLKIFQLKAKCCFFIR